MTTMTHLPVGDLKQHPRNIRRTTRTDPELVDSIRSAGIHEPLIAGPEIAEGPDAGVRYVLGGNRRLAAAVEAGLEQVPVVLRDDLTTEAQQLEVMLVENLMRSDLTAVEEADAYEQLTLAGMDASAIARSTGRAKSTVKDRLRLAAAPERARDFVHAGQATLEQVYRLAEFEDDHEAHARVLAALGSRDFEYTYRLEKARGDRVHDNAAQVAAALEAGWVDLRDELDTDKYPVWNYESGPCPLHDARPATLEAQGHDGGCLGFYLASPDSHSFVTVCRDPGRHRDPDEESPESPPISLTGGLRQEIYADPDYAEAVAAAAAAQKSRREWIQQRMETRLEKILTPEALPDLRTVAAGLVLTEHMGIFDDHDVLLHQLMVTPTRALVVKTLSEFFANSISEALADVPPTLLDSQAWEWDAIVYPAHAEAVWEWMESAGYEMSTRDLAERDAVQRIFSGDSDKTPAVDDEQDES